MGKLGKSLKYVIGIILSMSVSIMLMGGSFSLDCFYDQGQVSDAYGMELELPGSNMVCQSGNRYWTVTKDAADKMMIFNTGVWNYFILDIVHLCPEEVEATLVFYLGAEETGRKEITLVPGKNIIDLRGEKFGNVILYLENAQGIEIGVKSAQVRERLGSVSSRKFFGVAILVFLLYLGVFHMVIKAIVKKKPEKNEADSYLLNLYLKVQEMVYLHMQKKSAVFSNKQKSYIRMAIFLLIVLYTTVIRNAGKIRLRSFSDLFFVIAFFFLAFFSVEKTPEKTYASKSMWGSFCLFYLLTCVSDFFVAKRIPYIGYVFLFAISLFYYAWGKMRKPEQILRELVWTIQFSFGVCVLFCIFCRPLTQGARYSGCFTNPNIFASYLVPVAVAWITCVEEYMRGQEHGKWKACFYGAEGCAILYFLWKTQSRGALLACLFTGILFFLRLWRVRIDMHQIKKALQILAVFLVLCVPVMEGMEWMLWNVPGKLHTEVVFQKDMKMAWEGGGSGSIFTETVQASQTRFVQRLKASSLDAFTSGRITVWKAYLRKMNLWGHEFREDVSGTKDQASHNMVIEIAYRYGVAAVAAFIVLWGFLLKRTWKGLGERKSFSFAPAGWLVSYVVLAMLDILEQPWIYIAWLLAYTVMGYWMTDDGNENDMEKMVEPE